MDYSTPGFPVHHQLPELTQTHVHQGDDAIQPSHAQSSPSSPSFNLSQHQDLFQWVNSSNQGPNYWSFTFSTSPSNEYSGLISLRIDWFDLLAVQGTCKSLLQYHSSKASILWCLAFFMVQPSHPYVTTGKTIALTRQTFVSKVMSLLFNMLSRLLIAFPPRGKCLLISWLQSPSAVILEPEKIKSVTVFIVSPSIFHKGMGPDVIIFVFLEYWVLIQLFHSPLSLSSRGSLVSLCLALSHCCLLLLCLFIVPRILQIYLIIPATPIIQFLPFKIVATFYGFLKMTPSSTALLPDFTTKL